MVLQGNDTNKKVHPLERVRGTSDQLEVRRQDWNVVDGRLKGVFKGDLRRGAFDGRVDADGLVAAPTAAGAGAVLRTLQLVVGVAAVLGQFRIGQRRDDGATVGRRLRPAALQFRYHSRQKSTFIIVSRSDQAVSIYFLLRSSFTLKMVARFVLEGVVFLWFSMLFGHQWKCYNHDDFEMIQF